MNLNGTGGTLFCGYQPAVRLGNWSVKPDAEVEGRSVISGEWVARDEYWSTQTLNKIVLELGKLRLAWSIPEWTGSQIIYVDGPPTQTVEDDEDGS